MATTFDADLWNRVIAFQQANGLTADGVADEKTWTKLAAGAEPQSATVQPEATPAEESFVALDISQFTLLADLVENCQDEQGVKDFFLRVAGLDIDAIARDIDEELNSGPSPEVTS